jgi:DNA mismatch repair protein MutH
MDEFKTREAVHNHGCEAVGKTMLELVNSMHSKLSGKKSRVGDAWESWFGIEKNSNPEPDLVEAGVELKTTGVVETRNGKSAKERLVLNIINYIEEYDKSFEESSFYKKNQYIEIGFYGYDKQIDWLNWKILKSVLFSFPLKDLLIIRHDWETIHSYIAAGRAHEITEGLTDYLAACTKGADRNSMREQAVENSPRAKQRAYSLKSTYMTQLIRKYVFGDEEDSNIRIDPFEMKEHEKDVAVEEIDKDSIVKNAVALAGQSLEQYIFSKLEPFVGKTVNELADFYGIVSEDGQYPKAINAMLASRMLGIHGDLENAEEFSKAGISVKTIQVSENGNIKENMSFPAFDFKELVKETWEESTLRDLLDSGRFFFVVFQKQADGRVIFRGAKFWCMPVEDLDSTVRDAWQQTVDTLKSGVQLEFDGSRVKNNFVKSSENRIIHVRPHASKASYMFNDTWDADELPVNARWINKPFGYSEKWMTKQCFWLNNQYVREQIQDLIQ